MSNYYWKEYNRKNSYFIRVFLLTEKKYKRIIIIEHLNKYSNVLQFDYKIEREYMEEENIEELQVVDIEKVQKVMSKMPSDELIFDLAEFFKVFGDSTRMKIICALLEEELCVGDIAQITNSIVSAISHQLRLLKQSKLVKYRKDGKAVYYSLDDEHVREIFKKGREHIEEV